MDRSTPNFLTQRGRGGSWSTTFPIFDTWIHSGDIRDQSRKLLEIAKILDDFLAFLNFWWRTFQKLYPVNHPWIVARRLKKFHKDTPTSPEVIEPNTVNFRPNFKFSRLNFLGGPSSPLGVCASKPWPISSALKNLRGQHPLRAEM